jgi:protein-tyrosine phosphatase
VKDVEGWGRIECVGVREQERTEIRELRVWKGVDENEEDEERGEGREDANQETKSLGEARTVWHFLFLGWPDHDIPVSPRDQSALLELIKLSRFRMQNETEKEDDDEAEPDEENAPPRIVHCSAGVGRTGTFIALDHLLHELKDGKFDCLADVKQEKEENDEDEDNDNDGMIYPKSQDDDPVFDTVKRLREQRMLLVGKPRQYAFIYQMLRERLVARATGDQASAMEGLSDGDESQIKKRKVALEGSGYENDLDGDESSVME